MNVYHVVRDQLMGHLRMITRIGTPEQVVAAQYWREKLAEHEVDNVVPMPMAACFARRDAVPSADGQSQGGGK
jgi:hypothetical protein